MRNTFLRRVAASIGALALLAACGGAEPQTSIQPAPSIAASPAGTAASASALPTREASLSALASALTSASSAPSVEASASSVASEQASSAASVAADGPYAALQQTKTPEGYYVLGDPGAPVTLTFYSDFI